MTVGRVVFNHMGQCIDTYLGKGRQLSSPSPSPSPSASVSPGACAVGECQRQH